MYGKGDDVVKAFSDTQNRKCFEVIQNIPSPYRVHLFTIMWRQLQEKGIDFHVNIMSDFSRGHAERPVSWHNPKMDFPYTYWKDYGYKNHHFNPGMIRWLRIKRPDYMLIGDPYDCFTSIFAAWLCPAKIRCSWVEGQTKTPGKMHGFLGWFKRLVLSRCPYVAVPGADGKKYIEMHQTLTKMKMPKSLYLPNLIDERRFKPRDLWPSAEIEKIRQEMCVKQDEKLCFIPARLTYVKGLDALLERLTPTILRGWKVIILGDGEQRADLLKIIAKNDLNNYVVIKSFVAYSEMPKWYAAADLFMLPSRHDPNPLSVVEALHSGLPVAISDRCGNVEEAVTVGGNGWILPIKDALGYSRALMNVFASSIDRLREMGKVSKNVHSQYWNSNGSVACFLDSMIGDKDES